jgi:hypothetical protein
VYDTEGTQDHSNEDAGVDITPTKRAMTSDGRGKRDSKMKDRVVACLKHHRLDINGCSLTNASKNTVALEYAHLLPLATPEIMVGFLKRSMAVTI